MATVMSSPEAFTRRLVIRKVTIHDDHWQWSYSGGHCGRYIPEAKGPANTSLVPQMAREGQIVLSSFLGFQNSRLHSLAPAMPFHRPHLQPLHIWLRFHNISPNLPTSPPMITTTSRPDTWATGPLRTNSTSAFPPTLVFSALTERTALYSPSFLLISGYLRSIQPWLLHIFVTAKCNESRAREEIRQWENGHQTPKQNSVLRGTLHPWTSAPTPGSSTPHPQSHTWPCSRSKPYVYILGVLKVAEVPTPAQVSISQLDFPYYETNTLSIL